MTSRVRSVDLFVMESFAFAITAPDWSITVPVRVAPDTCAWTGAEKITARANIAYAGRSRTITIDYLHVERFGGYPVGTDRSIYCNLSTVNTNNNYFLISAPYLASTS